MKISFIDKIVFNKIKYIYGLKVEVF